MKLMFKHILKSIIHSPWQSIVIFVTAVISAMIFACVPSVYGAISDEREFMSSLKYGNADACISADVSSGERYVTFSELGNELPSDTKAVGYFALPISDGNGSVLCAVTDFYNISEIFDFYFTDYGTVSDVEVNNTVFITEDFALEHSLKVGDSFKTTVLGIEKTYTVQGINAYRFFGSYDALLHSDGVLDVLSSLSPIFTVFDSENYPCNSIYLCGDSEKILNALEKTGLDVTDCAEIESGYDELMVFLIISAVMLLSVILAGILVGISLEILGKRRLAEAKAFHIAGMTSRQINLAFLAEIFSYILFAGVLGVICAPVILSDFAKSFEYAFPKVDAFSVICCAVCELAVMAVAVLMFFFSVRNREGKKHLKVIFPCVISLLVVTTSLSFSAPVRAKVIFVIPAVILWILTVILGIKPLCIAISRFTRREKPIAISLAVKNNGRVSEIHSIYRILSIVLSICAVLTVTVSYFDRRVQGAHEVLECDYIATGVEEGAKEQAESVLGTERADYAVFAQAELDGQRTLYLIDTNVELISDNALSGGIEQGGIYIPKSIARFYGISMGDTFSLNISGKEYEFKLQGYCNELSVFAFADLKGHGFEENILLISANSGEEYVQALSKSLSTQGGFVSDTEELVYAYTHFLTIAQGIMQKYIIFLTITSIVGALNLIFVCYARRKNQFRELHTIGMPQRSIMCMVISEISIILVVCIFLCLFGGTLLTFLLNSATHSFGYSLF